MSETDIDPRWRPRLSAPFRIKGGDVARISSDEFIVVMVYYVDLGGSCWVPKQACYHYNSFNDEWIKWSRFPASLDHIQGAPDYPRIAVIPQTGTIYISADFWRVYEMGTLECLEVYGDEELYALSPSVNANGILHCVGVGMEDEADHCIWIPEEKELQCIHKFGDILGIPRDEYDDLLADVTEFTILFVESKQLILLIGVPNYNVEDVDWGIWSFSTKNIIENTWKRIEGVNLDFNRVSAVLTADQQFVILSGGQHMMTDRDSPTASDVIHVLDIRDEDNFILRQCSIRCPALAQCITFRTGNGLNLENQLCVVGWIRKVFQREEMKHMRMPPDGVMRLIVDWVDCELLHWIYCSWLEPVFNIVAPYRPEGTKCSDHFVIPVQDILSSLCPLGARAGC